MLIELTFKNLKVFKTYKKNTILNQIFLHEILIELSHFLSILLPYILC